MEQQEQQQAALKGQVAALTEKEAIIRQELQAIIQATENHHTYIT